MRCRWPGKKPSLAILFGTRVAGELATSREGRGCPCPVAGRSLRPSGPSLSRRRLRFAIHGSAGRLRRLPGHGQPLPAPWPPNSPQRRSHSRGASFAYLRALTEHRSGRIVRAGIARSAMPDRPAFMPGTIPDQSPERTSTHRACHSQVVMCYSPRQRDRRGWLFPRAARAVRRRGAALRAEPGPGGSRRRIRRVPGRADYVPGSPPRRPDWGSSVPGRH